MTARFSSSISHLRFDARKPKVNIRVQVTNKGILIILPKKAQRIATNESLKFR